MPRDLSLNKKMKNLFVQSVMRNVASKKGFTLIELIVVLAVVAIVTTISWSALSGMKNRANVNNACGQVSAMINKTRNYALSGKKVNGVVPASFTVSVNGSDVTIAGGGTTMETYTIPGGVNCVSSSSWSSTYNVPNAVGTSSASITCSSNNVSRTVVVTPYLAVCN